MKHRVKPVWKHEVESALKEVDRDGSELLRILDLPCQALSAADCSLCRETLCPGHQLRLDKMKWDFLGQETKEIQRSEIEVMADRLALVYREL